MCTCDFDGGPTFRGPIRVAVSFPYASLCKSCYRISSVTNTIETQLWSNIVGPIAKLCMCQTKCKGAPKGGIVEKHPPPLPHLRYAVVSLFSTKNVFPTNRMRWSDLKGCMKKCRCFRCHFELNILTPFGIFCRFGSLCTNTPNNGYNKFDWLTLVWRSN